MVDSGWGSRPHPVNHSPHAVAVTSIPHTGHSNTKSRRQRNPSCNVAKMCFEPGVVDEPQVACPQLQSSHHPKTGIHGKDHGPRPATLDSEQNLP